MGQEGLASVKKNAARLKAYFVFMDESGLLMAPLVRRSWSPRGQTPILHQRTRSHEKVSMIAALSVSPQRRRVGLYFSLGVGINVNTAWIQSFLSGLARHLRGPIVVVWDRLPGHRAQVVNHFVARHPRIDTVLLPPYAPELNPVEAFWSYLKTNPLANLAAHDAEQLRQIARRHAHRIRNRQDLLKSFIRSTPLSFWPR